MFFKTSIQIKNGSRDGITLLTQSIKLSLAAVKEDEEKQTISIKSKTIMQGKI